MAGFIKSKQSISMHLRNNLMTLSMLHPSRKEIEVVLKEDNLFTVPQKQAMQYVFHFLLPIMFELKTVRVRKSCHTYHWPLLGRDDETQFRNTVRNVLLELVENHPEASLSKINASFLMNPGGDKFVQYMWTLTTFLLEKSVEALGDVKLVKRTHDPDDSLLDAKLKMYQMLANKETREYVKNREKTSKLKETGRAAAKELSAEIKSATIQWTDARTRLQEVTAAVPLSEEMKRSLATNHDETVSKWALAMDKMVAEVAALTKRMAYSRRRVGRDVEVVRSAVESHVTPTVLDRTELGIKIPSMVLEMPGCEGLSEKLYVNNELNLSALMTVGIKAVESLSNSVRTEAAAYVTDRLDDLTAMKHEADSWNAYFSKVEPRMTATSAVSKEKSDRFYARWASENQEKIAQHLEEFSFLGSTDPTLPATPYCGAKYAKFEITPDPNRHNGLIKGRCKGNNAPEVIAKMPAQVSMNSTLNSTFNRSTFANSTSRPRRFSNVGIRSLMERAQNNTRTNTSQLNLQSFEQSLIDGQTSRVLFSGNRQSSVSVSKPIPEQSVDIYAGGDAHASLAASPTGGPLKGTSVAASYGEEYSFITNGLFDTNKSDAHTPDSTARGDSSVIRELVNSDHKVKTYQSPDYAAGGKYTSSAANLTGSPLESISSTNLSAECSFLGIGLFDSDKSDIRTPDSSVVRKNYFVVKETANCDGEGESYQSPLSTETHQKTSSPLGNSHVMPLYNSSFAMGLRRNSMKKSPFITVPEDSPVSDISSITCTPPFLSDRNHSADLSCLDTTSLSPMVGDTDSPLLSHPMISHSLHINTNNTYDKTFATSSFGDMLSESEIVHFSPFLVNMAKAEISVLSPPGATEDGRQDIATPLQSLMEEPLTPVNIAMPSQSVVVPATPASSMTNPTPSRRGRRPSLDAVIARYRRIKEKATNRPVIEEIKSEQIQIL